MKTGFPFRASAASISSTPGSTSSTVDLWTRALFTFVSFPPIYSVSNAARKAGSNPAGFSFTSPRIPWALTICPTGINSGRIEPLRCDSFLHYTTPCPILQSLFTTVVTVGNLSVTNASAAAVFYLSDTRTKP